MKKIFLLTFVLSIFLVSCQHIEKKTSAILDKEEALEKWIGQPKSELLEVYGLPTEVKKDEHGNHLEPQFKKGDKVTYLGNPGEITKINKTGL